MPGHAAPTSNAPLGAATVLVLRAADSTPGADIEVLLVRRSHRASFMANAYVFPGGRVDAADAVALAAAEVKHLLREGDFDAVFLKLDP